MARQQITRALLFGGLDQELVSQRPCRGLDTFAGREVENSSFVWRADDQPHIHLATQLDRGGGVPLRCVTTQLMIEVSCDKLGR